MIVDLVRVTTRDGLRLDGALQLPEHAGDGPVDAVICLHGAGSNFYGAAVTETVAASLCKSGVAALRVNTRGHDAVYTALLAGKNSRQGAAYEILDDCRHDVFAWIDYLIGKGYKRIGLFGHSLGALKAVYTQASEPHPAVTRLMAASAPRLAYSAFSYSDQSRLFFETLATAEEHVREDRSDTLMNVRFPIPMLISAATYVDKYGRTERYNIMRLLGRLTCKSLFVYGGDELIRSGIAFAGMDESIRKLAHDEQIPAEVITIDSADHFYTGRRDQLAEKVVEWLGGA